MTGREDLCAAREVKLSYRVVERFGHTTVEIDASNEDERVTIYHAAVNPDYKYGKEQAAWGIVVDALARLLAGETR